MASQDRTVVESRTVRPLLAVVTALAVLLTSCLPEDDRSDPRGTEREPLRIDASLGLVRVAPGEPIDLRVVLDGAEDPEELGAVLAAAFAAAVEDFGVIRQSFRVDLGDRVVTDCSRADGARVGAELSASEGIVAVLGPQCTETLLGLQGAVSASGLSLVTPRPIDLMLTEAPDGGIAQDRAEGVWRTSPSVMRQAQAAAEYASVELELTRAVTLHDGGLESMALATVFRQRFEALGGTVIVFSEVDGEVTSDDEERAATARRSLLDTIGAADVDVAFLALSPEALVRLGEGWRERSRLVAVTRIITSPAATSAFLEDEATLDHLVMAPRLDIFDTVSTVTGMSASQTLERVASLSRTTVPAGWWAYAYDAATLLLKSIEDASLIDADGSLVISRAELRATIATTTFGGLTGRITCNVLGDCAAPRTLVLEHSVTTSRTLADLAVVGVVDLDLGVDR